MSSNVERREIQSGNAKIEIETGKVARQAAGAVTVRVGDTVVLVASAFGTKPREGTDFFPLTVDYRERTYAAGRIPGGFFKREGKARDREVLTSRLIDRTIRPLFPEHIRLDVQITALVVSADEQNSPDIPAMIGASAALALSHIPWNGPVGAVRIGEVEGKLVVNPTLEDQEKSTLDLIVAGKKGAIMMVESGANELSEDRLLEALGLGQMEIDRQCDLISELAGKKAPAKADLPAPAVDAELVKQVDGLARAGYKDAVKIAEKTAREKVIRELKEKVQTTLAEKYPEGKGVIAGQLDQIEYEEMRALILNENRRTDGRGLEDIRPISVETTVLPRAHGSALFTRGQTQALATATLGSPADMQIMDELAGEYKERFLMHYNFPSFCTGETKPERGPGRREIGHGMLSRRALTPLLPTPEEFPYTIRVVSDILESNGSSSMASVCGGSLALFDAGVPLKKAVAGIAMGLIKEGEKWAVLTDIMGMEDHLGDMDFKVAGTVDGVTALQMDIKIEGVSIEVMKKALEQAKRARLKILEIMTQALGSPRPDLSPYAPRMVVVKIPVDKIGALIGPGGKNIRRIIEESGAQVDVEDDGKVYITSADQGSMQAAKSMVESLTVEIEVGKIYKGTVVRIMPKLGAFVEVLPGKDGLVHISQLAVERVERVEDAVKVGDEIEVKCIEVDSMGRVNLSRKAVIKPGSELEGGRPGGDRGGDRGGFRDRGRGGDRGGSRDRGGPHGGSGGGPHGGGRPRGYE
jgi:polyribonucleotide nucleotidyltransferase